MYIERELKTANFRFSGGLSLSRQRTRTILFPWNVMGREMKVRQQLSPSYFSLGLKIDDTLVI